MYDTIRFDINVSEGWRGVRLHDGRARTAACLPQVCTTLLGLLLMFPKAGGEYAYTMAVLGPLPAFLKVCYMYDTIRFVINVSEGWRGVRLHDGRARTAACLPQVCTTLLGLLLMFPKAGGEYAYTMAVLAPLPAFLKYVRHY